MPSPAPNTPAVSQNAAAPKGRLFEGVTAYHWLVVIFAAAGWLFDCSGQRIFVLARDSAVKDLLGPGATKEVIDSWTGWATAVLMIGWGTGGIVFGMMSDRFGRVKTMVAALLAYSIFSGMCGLARSPVDFLIYRFIGGLGVGGMFGAATTLVAESVPAQIRPLALGVFQALSSMGNIAGSLVCLGIKPGGANYWMGAAGWRWVFLAGAVPAVLVVPMALVLREPEVWRKARQKLREGADTRKHIGSVPDLFRDSTLRRHTLVGVLLGFAGMAGLWGVGFFSPKLISTALKDYPPSFVDTVRAYGTMYQDVGSFFGILAFTFAANRIGRKPVFAAAFILCLGTTLYVFARLHSASDAYWMLPMMGFAQLSLFGGYTIYFPELFPARLRGTGVGFCYNTVRYLAAAFPPLLSRLTDFFSHNGTQEPLRRAASLLSFVFLLGLIALIWAPETKDKPLPE